jgi:hypothetical protein
MRISPERPWKMEYVMWKMRSPYLVSLDGCLTRRQFTQETAWWYHLLFSQCNTKVISTVKYSANEFYNICSVFQYNYIIISIPTHPLLYSLCVFVRLLISLYFHASVFISLYLRSIHSSMLHGAWIQLINSIATWIPELFYLQQAAEQSVHRS